jgi:hypothetical protein
LRVDSDNVSPASPVTSRAVGVTRHSMNYPIVFDSCKGEVAIANVTGQVLRVFVILPDSFWNFDLSSGANGNLKMKFAGFAIVGMLAKVATEAAYVVDVVFNLEAKDYV